LLLLLLVTCRSVIVPEAFVPVKHVPESAPEPFGHDAVEQRVDAAAQVVADACEGKARSVRFMKINTPCSLNEIA